MLDVTDYHLNVALMRNTAWVCENLPVKTSSDWNGFLQYPAIQFAKIMTNPKLKEKENLEIWKHYSVLVVQVLLPGLPNKHLYTLPEK